MIRSSRSATSTSRPSCCWRSSGSACRSPGSLGLLYLTVFIFFFTTLGMGTLVSTIAKTYIQAVQLIQFFLMPSMLLSGFIFSGRGDAAGTAMDLVFGSVDVFSDHRARHHHQGVGSNTFGRRSPG